jgi:hypothetical protein
MFENNFVTLAYVMCYNGYMSETTGSTESTKKPRSRIIDVIIGLAVLAVIVVLLLTLLSQLRLKHEISAATAVTDRMITDIQKQSGADAHSLGDATFQKQNPTALLTAQFKAVNSHVHGTAVRDRTTITNTKSGQAVSVIYKYASKPTFYIRVITTKPKGASSWHVVNLSGNPKESALLNNKY